MKIEPGCLTISSRRRSRSNNERGGTKKRNCSAFRPFFDPPRDYGPRKFIQFHSREFSPDIHRIINDTNLNIYNCVYNLQTRNDDFVFF